MTAPALEHLFAAMQTAKSLPALEDTVTQVLGSLNDFRKGHRDVASHIVQDAALTQRVLKLANSAMYAPFGGGASTVSAAVSILGADAVLHIVLGTAMVTAAELEGEESLSRVLLASELARTLCSGRSEDVSIAALMYDLGRLMATRFLAMEVTRIDQRIRAGAAAETAEREVLGITLQELGAGVALRWHLPHPIVSIIDGTGDPALVGIARFSSTAAALIHEGQGDEVARLLEALDIPDMDTEGAALLIGRKLQEITPVARVAIPAAGPSGAQGALEDLFAALSADRRKTVEDLAAVMFAQLAQALGTAHCLLFMQTRSGEFAIRFGYGKGIEELKARLRLSAAFKPTAFHAAIRNNVDISIADVSKLKPSALPDGYRALLPRVNRFIILPVAHSRVAALVYCDWDAGEPLSAQELDAVKNLRTLFLPFVTG